MRNVVIGLMAVVFLAGCNAEEDRRRKAAEQAAWEEERAIELEEHLAQGAKVLSSVSTDYGVVLVLDVSTQDLGMPASQICTVFLNRNGSSMSCNEPSIF